MVTVLEGSNTEEQRSFYGQNNSVQKNYSCLKEGSVCHVKQLRTTSKNIPHGRSKVADDAGPCAEVAETTATNCCRFRRTGKAM
jgi:hypothetical protein